MMFFDIKFYIQYVWCEMTELNELEEGIPAEFPPISINLFSYLQFLYNCSVSFDILALQIIE
jgi:hypothetical protein